MVRRLAFMADIRPHIRDDYSPEDWKPSAWGIYLRADTNAAMLGVFAMMPRNGVTLEAHTLFARGRRAAYAARLTARWIWDNTHYLRVITTVPEYNRLAMKLAIDAGMEKFGYDPNSYMRGGVLMGQYLFGMSKPCR